MVSFRFYNVIKYYTYDAGRNNELFAPTLSTGPDTYALYAKYCCHF